MIGMLYWEYYLLGIILLPGIIFGIIAQQKVTSAYNAFSKLPAKVGKTSKEIARLLLDTAQLQNVKISQAKGGAMSDYYDPSQKTVALSAPESNSVADISIAAHEVGHALQYKTNYVPIKIRTFAIKLSNFTSNLMLPLIILALLFNFCFMPNSIVGTVILWIGVGLFGLGTFISLVTLPVEYNASKRASKILQQSGIFDAEETGYAKRMLNAAALTYVASLLISVLSLLRILLIVFKLKGDD